MEPAIPVLPLPNGEIAVRAIKERVLFRSPAAERADRCHISPRRLCSIHELRSMPDRGARPLDFLISKLIIFNKQA
jgi:hypothetical protein